MPIYVYDSIQPATNLIPFYSGPRAEAECIEVLQSKVADASAIFGEGSTMSVGQSVDPAAFLSTSMSDYLSLTDNIVYKGVVIALFIYYCFLVFHFRDCIVSLFKMMKTDNAVSDLLNDSTYIFSLFLRSTTILWFTVCGVGLVKVADIFAGDIIAGSLPQWAVILGIIPVSVVMTLIMLYKKSFFGLIDNVTLGGSFTQMLNYIKTLHNALAVLTIVPSILLLALYNGELQTVLLYIVAAEIVIISALWLYKSYMLFIEQNVSILHWILYLCTIEIFPFTLLILISLRLT